ncbi:MAG: DUF3108 domain-containing protein [Candidatus Omnitrophota bacterium]
MKRILLFIILASLFFAGCAKTARIRRPSAKIALSEKIEDPSPAFTVGERLTYMVAWKGIRVGTGTITIEELTSFKGYEVYKVVAIARTNEFLSRLYKVEDTFISYIDTGKLISRHYESIQREGRYKKDLVVDYDFDKKIAIYKNLLDGSVKTCKIEENVQDPVSAAFFFRTIQAKVGDTIKITVNLNERNYEIFANISKRAEVVFPGIGAFDAFLLKPYVMKEGKRQRDASAWGYISSDEKRLGLYIVLKILKIPLVGEVTATLEKVEYLNSQRRSPDP